MNYLQAALLLSATMALPAFGQAGVAAGCPGLPADSGLQWTQQQAAGFTACRASTADGREVLSLLLTGNDPGIELQRALRQERDEFAGQRFFWYQPDLGGQQPEGYAHRRVSVIRLDRDRFAQLALYPASEQERDSLQHLLRGVRLTSTAVAAGN